LVDKNAPRFTSKVKNGPQTIDLIVRLPPNIMENIVIKGTRDKYLSFKFLKKGFLGKAVLTESEI
jgi:hypothetical protein